MDLCQLSMLQILRPRKQDPHVPTSLQDFPPINTACVDDQTSTDVEELGTFLNESVAAGTEGLIVKTMDSTYEPSRRSSHWLKLKKDYLEGVGDTLDVAVIGAWFGRYFTHAIAGST